MNSKNITTMLIIVCLSAATIIVGCKKKEQPAAPPKAITTADMQMQATKTAEDANKATTAVAKGEQTLCPVTGDKIDKNVFVEYKGKKVYFCCSMCVAQFNKNPEKYISKLPQFAK